MANKGKKANAAKRAQTEKKTMQRAQKAQIEAKTSDPNKEARTGLIKLNHQLEECLKQVKNSNTQDSRVKLARKGQDEYVKFNEKLSRIYKVRDPVLEEMKANNRSLYDELNKITETHAADLKSIQDKGGKELDELHINASIRIVNKKINDILKELSTKIDSIKDKKTLKVAKTLYKELDQARENYIYSLKSYSNKKDEAETAKDIFKMECRQAIDRAMPTLEKDLGLGQYLKNLINSLVKAITGGKRQGFFEHQESEATKTAREVGDKLKGPH